MRHAIIVVDNADARRAENVIRLHIHQLVSMKTFRFKTVFDVSVDEQREMTLDQLEVILKAGGLDVAVDAWP